LLPIGRSGWAIVAGYLGLLSCIPLVGLVFAIAAIVTGFLALRDCQRNPELGGRGRAMFGIIVGSLVLVLQIVGIAASLGPRLGR
jgi:hypothetical protein